MGPTDQYDPRAAIAARPMTLAQWLIIAIPVLINLVDGFDVRALAQAADPLSKEWKLSPGELGELLSYNLIGMAVGALAVSPMADSIGRRPAILLCLTLMTLGMFGAALSTGYWSLAAARLVTGIGIGGMTSTAGAIAMEYASAQRRELAPSMVAAAYPVGSIVGGFVAIAVLGEFGWRGIFWFGGLLSLVLIPISWLWLPESLDFLLARQPRNALAKTNRILTRLDLPLLDALPPSQSTGGGKAAALKEIVRPENRFEVMRLCLAQGLNMFSFYFIINWAPKWVTELGFSTETGISYSIFLSVGGIAGALFTGWIAWRVGVRNMMIATLVGMAALIALFGSLPANTALLAGHAVPLGAAMFGSAAACWLTIAYAFPPQLRATGLGIGTTFGRIGSVFGPSTAGYLLEAGMGKPLICMLLAAPAVLASFIFMSARRI